MESPGVTRVLIVEDEPHIRATVRDGLESRGCIVAEAASAEDALANFRNVTPHIVLVDVMLPGIDGMELCRHLRATSDVPIIIVSARGDITNIVHGLEAGADDYMTKPVDTVELHARICALLRRTRHTPNTPQHLVGDLDIRPDEGRVLRAGVEVKLTKTEFRLLCELAAAPDKVFSRELLIERVWGGGYYGDERLVDVHIRRLRTKIEPDPANPRHVITVRGLGYRLDRQTA
ncbi:MAG: Two component transcriptional regulatory protein afsQ1 [Actinomycetota bacterium]|jgi:DNA-binding response OmpR family regulator